MEIIVRASLIKMETHCVSLSKGARVNAYWNVCLKIACRLLTEI